MYGKECYKEILFTDEKIFTLEETSNKQNDRVYVQSSKEAHELVPRIKRGHYPTSVIVYLHFYEKDVKTAARNYQQDVLTNVVEPLNSCT